MSEGSVRGCDRYFLSEGVMQMTDISADLRALKEGKRGGGGGVWD